MHLKNKRIIKRNIIKIKEMTEDQIKSFFKKYPMWEIMHNWFLGWKTENF